MSSQLIPSYGPKALVPAGLAAGYQLWNHYGPIIKGGYKGGQAVYQASKPYIQKTLQWWKNKQSQNNPRKRFRGGDSKLSFNPLKPSGMAFRGGGGAAVARSRRRRRTFRRRRYGKRKFRRRFSYRGRRRYRRKRIRASLFKMMTPKQVNQSYHTNRLTCDVGKQSSVHLSGMLMSGGDFQAKIVQARENIEAQLQVSNPFTSALSSLFIGKSFMSIRISSSSLVTTKVEIRMWKCVDDFDTLPLTILGNDLAAYMISGEPPNTGTLHHPWIVPGGELQRRWRCVSKRKFELGAGQVKTLGYKKVYNKFLSLKAATSNSYLKGYSYVFTATISGYPVHSESSNFNLSTAPTAIDITMSEKNDFRFLVNNRPSYRLNAPMPDFNDPEFTNQYTTSKATENPVTGLSAMPLEEKQPE